MNIPLKPYWNLLSRHIQPQKARFVQLALLLLGSIGLQLVTPQIVRTFIDAASAGQETRRLVWAALAFLGMSLLQQVVAVGTTYVGENVAWTATNALRAELTYHCLGLDMSFHSDHTPGELIERIDGDVAKLATFFSQAVIYVLGNLLLLAGITAALLLEEWRVGLAFIPFVVLSLLVLNRVRSLAVPYFKAQRQAEADLFGYIEEQLSGSEDVRSSGAVDFVLRGLYRLQRAILHHNRQASMRQMWIGLTTGMLLTLGNVMAILAGYWLYRSGTITVGAVYLIIYYINLVARPIRDLAHQVEGLQTAGASIERLVELRQVRSRVNDGPGNRLPDGPLALSFEDVSFAYVAHEPVLKALSFDLQEEQVLGLLGRTGSGKTTLARLVLRLHDPTSGQIRLNGINLRQPTLQALRQRVAMVTQDVQLFEATVRDNLTFFDPGIPDERIQAAIEALGLSSWLRSLPDGLDTRLESGTSSLSAGEAQLLAFTRVFLRDPGLIILDEASSRLDPATEGRIEHAISRLLRGRTAIVIAHRLSTVQRADEIMILDQGQALERGPREGLTTDPTSHFFHLLQTGLEEVLA
jgi:ABC-type multidrug transport system fused ATPase/permease subunit